MQAGKTFLRSLAVVSAVGLISWYVFRESGSPRVLRANTRANMSRVSNRLLGVVATSPTTNKSTTQPAMLPGSKSYTGVAGVEGGKLLMSSSKSAPVFNANTVPPATEPTTLSVSGEELIYTRAAVMSSSKSGRIFEPQTQPAEPDNVPIITVTD